MILPPEGVQIPRNHNPVSPRVFDDNSLFFLKASNRGQLKVEGQDGEFDIKSKEDILKLFKTKYNWTYSHLGEIDCLFKFFSTEQLSDLKFLNVLEFGDYQLHWIIGTSKIRLTKNNSPKSSKFLINVDPWVYREYEIKGLHYLKYVVEKLISLNEIIPINMTSPASTTKDMLLTGNSYEFTLFNKLPYEDTKFLHSCYVGPRMESQCLGTIEGVENQDQIKAYLRALARVPSLDKFNVLKVLRSTTFIPEAHPGSGYKIKVSVPKTYSAFAPIPVRLDGRIPYPQGEFETKVSKPYLDLLNKLGDIPYEILEAVQIIPKSSPKYPFKQLSLMVEYLEENFKDRFYPINLKALHYPLVGHMLHFHKNIDYKTGETTYETSSDYNPINACAIQGMVAAELWEFAHTTRTEAIRVDALSGYNLPKRNGYKKEDAGLMTFLTPGLKDKPGSTMYRDLIYLNRDNKEVLMKFPVRNSLKQYFMAPSKIGIVKNQTVSLPPMGGVRHLERKDRRKRLGELLERRIPLPIPTINTWEEPDRTGGYIDWIDKYLTLFPQTQTLTKLGK